jgi:hypothetical protein
VKNIVIAAMVVLVVTGCARRPDSIAPASIPFEAYASMDCAQINSLLISERQILTSLEAQQNSAANGDALGVFLIGVPVSSLTGGDQEGNIAVSKGKVQALEAAQLQNNCATA